MTIPPILKNTCVNNISQLPLKEKNEKKIKSPQQHQYNATNIISKQPDICTVLKNSISYQKSQVKDKFCNKNQKEKVETVRRNVVEHTGDVTKHKRFSITQQNNTTNKMNNTTDESRSIPAKH